MHVHVHICNDLSSDYGTHVVVNNYVVSGNFWFSFVFVYYGNVC